MSIEQLREEELSPEQVSRIHIEVSSIVFNRYFHQGDISLGKISEWI